jgi:fatty-acyl-CoA synthase
VSHPASTYEMIRNGAIFAPGAPALSFFLTADQHRNPETWDYRQLFARITQTASFFHRLGATKETRIAFVLPNLPETHFAIWGGEAAGIVVALNPLLEGAALDAAGAEILVTLAPFPGVDLWSKLQPVLARVPTLKHLVLVDLADRVRGPRSIAAKLAQRREVLRRHGLFGIRRAVPKRIAIHDFTRSLCREDTRALASGRRFSPDDASSWFCTGGTTGLPKLAMRTHGNEVANARSTAQLLGDGIGVGKVVFCGLPLFHVNAALVTGLVAFSRGAHVILGTPQGYRGPGVVPRFWEIVEHHRVNFFSGVPTLYASLLDVPIGAHDVSSLEFALCGAAPMPTEVFRAFEARTGVRILEGYGLTEATCVSSANPPRGERRLGSIGLAVPGQKMKCVVLDDRGHYARDCAADEVGVVVVAGPNVFRGYRDPRHDAGLWIDCGDGERWLNTGDLGRRDRDGYFWLTGRRKELIIRGGHNIDPAAIEEPLHRHPGVQLAAAVGRPDVHAGELPIAYVQLKEGASVSEGELAEHLRREIAERAALPKQVRIVDAMPLTGVGKIYKPALKRSEAKDALEAALREARVAFRAIDIVDDPARGMAARVRVDGEEADVAARQVLGRFTLPFTIVAAPEEGTRHELDAR